MSARVSSVESELSSCLADLSASQTLAREQAEILRLPASKQERAARNAADKAIKANTFTSYIYELPSQFHISVCLSGCREQARSNARQGGESGEHWA